MGSNPTLSATFSEQAIEQIEQCLSKGNVCPSRCPNSRVGLAFGAWYRSSFKSVGLWPARNSIVPVGFSNGCEALALIEEAAAIGANYLDGIADEIDEDLRQATAKDFWLLPRTSLSLVRDEGVAGSNPATPTNLSEYQSAFATGCATASGENVFADR